MKLNMVIFILSEVNIMKLHWLKRKYSFYYICWEKTLYWLKKNSLPWSYNLKVREWNVCYYMTEKTIGIFEKETFAKPPKKNFITDKNNIYPIDDTRSLDLIERNVYGAEKKRSYGYVLLAIGSFSKFGGAVPFRNENVQAIFSSLEKILNCCKDKLILVEGEDGTEFENKICTNLPKNNNTEKLTVKTSLDAVSEERFICTVSGLLKTCFWKTQC